MWSSDNAVFNVNGKSESRLRDALSLALNGGTVAAYKFIQSKGLVLYSYASSGNNGVVKFPTPLSANEVSGIVIKWLQSEEAKSVPCEGWDADADHDGDNEIGWRVYTEDWGHVEGEWDALAIKPAYMWYGK